MFYETAWLWYPLAVYSLLYFFRTKSISFLASMNALYTYKVSVGYHDTYKKQGSRMFFKLMVFSGGILFALAFITWWIKDISLLGFTIPAWIYLAFWFIALTLINKYKKRFTLFSKHLRRN